MLKQTLPLIVSFLFCFTVLYAQISDDFSDGNFTENPTWEGNGELFIISSQLELQLNANDAGVAFLSTNCNSIEQTDMVEWRFKIRLAFAPSANNFAKIYLGSDIPDLSNSSLSGYYLKFGENGANDAIELYNQHNGNSQLVCRGSPASVATAFTLNVKVTCHAGSWKIYIDEQLNGFYRLDAEGESQNNYSNSFMGVVCTYTTTNKNKFFFDDFYFGTPIIDTVPPEILFAKGTQDLNSIVVRFSENIPEESALIPENYFVAETGSPFSCQYGENGFDEVLLLFPETFQEGRTYPLFISEIADFSGNIMESDTVDIFFYTIKRNDILITEIMEDPTPAIALPPYEYIELFNSREFQVELKGWKIQIGQNVKLLPDIILPARGYGIIISSSTVDYYSFCPLVYSISSLNIADAGQRLILYNSSDQVMHTVNFRENWHRSVIKREGGWSLEMIDTQNPCTGKDNWDSSVSGAGGTPCAANSIAAGNPDITLPEIERASLIDSTALMVFFSEMIVPESDRLPQLISVDRELEIVSVSEQPPDNRSLKIVFREPLRQHVTYTLAIRDSICDCTGNRLISGSNIHFGIPENPEKRDLIINEIMTNAKGKEDADYIEVYNNSKKIIDLKEVKIGSGGDNLPEKTILMIGEGYQFLPGEYLVLCKNREITVQQYYTPFPKKLIECDSLPSYTAASGTVHLTDIALNSLDRLQYSENMHYQLLNSTDGVALERIHFDSETEDCNNWKSASANVGFGTPGYCNSQHSDQAITTDLLTVTPEVFSPDNDGFDDFTEIYCKFREHLNRVTIYIYARDGTPVKCIANNIPCSIEEHFLWDGVSEKGSRLPPGLYLVKMEYWNENGKRKSVKKTVGIR